MQTITATELARNLRQVLDRLAMGGEDLVVERNQRPIARLLSIPPRQTALEAMADVYRTLPEAAGQGWLEDARGSDAALGNELRDPWAS
jgi:antitoxin (DNA-binding transcriptional repressor) of toxin-antitoxin stability system